MAALIVAGLLGFSAVAAARPFVVVDHLRLDRQSDHATVTGRVRWHLHSARPKRDMRRGDVRLVAVSDHGHRATLLGRVINKDIPAVPVQEVSITVEGDARLAAMRPGNRIVLTASQRRPTNSSPSDRAYVTVGQVQRYRSAQPHIGTDNCSDRAIVPGAILDYCDLVGADLDRVLVSLHAPSAFECQVASASTCMRRADLTGATLVDANLTGLNVAGARMNGADLTGATLDNVSMAAVEAYDLKAFGATSDQHGDDIAANLFEAQLAGADLRGTVFNGVSMAQADLRRVSARGARWTAVTAHGTDFRGADLGGLTIRAVAEAPVDFDFANFTDAVLSHRGRQSDITEADLTWAYLCRTALTSGARINRDCHTRVEAPTTPLPGVAREQPFVTISDATIDRASRTPRRIGATIDWATGAGMPSGLIRVLVVDHQTGLPTVIDEQRYRGDLPEQTIYAKVVDDRALLDQMSAGNRIVLTASQYPLGQRTPVTYVTVATLQRGPGRGRVGMYDCSRVALTAVPAQFWDFCDLTGAELSNAEFNTAMLREASLTGASMSDGRLAATAMSGAAMGGVNADRAQWSNVDIFMAHAPRFSMADGQADGSALRAANLDEANFDHAELLGETSTLAGAPLRRANFTGAKLNKTDLAFTNLFGASFAGAESLGTTGGGSTLFMANLTRADLTDSTWTPDEAGEAPWNWATLCDTKMPQDPGGISGDRDCPR